MDADAFARLFRLICRGYGLPSGRFTGLINGWSVFPYQFYENAISVGVKIMAYRDIAGTRKRAAQMGWNHLVNCVVSGMGAPTSGLGAVGSGAVTFAGKFGGLSPAFGVNMGGVGASEVMRAARHEPNPQLRAAHKTSAILGSNHLLMFGLARIDRLQAIGYDVWFKAFNRPDEESDYLEREIRMGRLDPTRFRRYRVLMNGEVTLNGARIGNARSRHL